MQNNWTEIQLKIDTAHLETASAVAQMTVPYGIYIEDYSDLMEQAPQIAHVDLIDEELMARDRTTAIIHLYISPEENPAESVSFITERLTAESIPFSIETGSVREEDWATSWKQYYHPVKVGRRVVVCPTWENYDPNPGEVVVRLDPGMAFGTGTHHTTQLCIRMLEEAVQPGCTLLDMGTGSGILSLVALELGAKSAVGVDIDPHAVQVATDNLRAQGWQSGSFAALCIDLVGDKKAAQRIGENAYDLVTANIVADAVIALAPAIHTHLRLGGAVIASGIISQRQEEAVAALKAAGLVVERIEEQGGWVAILAYKKL